MPVDESIKKTIKHLKNGSDGYDTIYQQTSSDLVMHSDDTTVAQHIDKLITDEGGVHGVRYNTETDMLEMFLNDEWVPVMFVGTYLLTQSGQVMQTRKGENISLY